MDYKELKIDSDCIKCVGCNRLYSSTFSGTNNCENFVSYKNKELNQQLEVQTDIELFYDLLRNGYHFNYVQGNVDSDIGFNAEFIFVGQGEGKYGKIKKIYTRDINTQKEIIKIFTGDKNNEFR